MIENSRIKVGIIHIKHFIQLYRLMAALTWVHYDSFTHHGYIMILLLCTAVEQYRLDISHGYVVDHRNTYEPVVVDIDMAHVMYPSYS